MIETALGRVLIWLPCRHHVAERVLEAVFVEVFGPTTAPEPPVMVKLEKQWPLIDKTKFVTYNSMKLTRDHLSGQADSIIEFATAKIKVSTFAFAML